MRSMTRHRSCKRSRCTLHRFAGLTLIECMIAALVLSIAVLGVLMPMITGHRCLQHADLHSRAIRIAENLLEEIVPRPYATGGPTRTEWGVDQYQAFSEQAGNLRDFSGQLCESEDQLFSRSVTVAPVTTSLAQIGGPDLVGKMVSVRVDGPNDESWTLRRVVLAPTQP